MNILIDATTANYWESADIKIRDAVLRSFDTETVKTRLCWETINEVVAVAGTKKDYRLRDRALLLLSMIHLAPYCFFGDIVLMELKGSDDFFWSSDQHYKMQSVLSSLARSGARSRRLLHLHKFLHQEKEKHYSGYHVIQDSFRKLLQGKPSITKQVTYEEYHSRYWDKWASKVDGMFKVNNSATSFSEAIRKPDRFPYTTASARTHTAILYRHLAQNRRVDRGDVFDASRLVYLAGGADLLTNDKGLSELAELVWGQSRKVIGFDEFVSRLV